MMQSFVRRKIRQIHAAVLILAMTGFSQSTVAASMSDLWWNPSESGWGANIIEQEGTLFITLFVYGPDGRPAWYVGPDTRQITSGPNLRVFSGPLYATTGSWFGAFFNPNSVVARQVGSVTFSATAPVSGTLTYTVEGVTVSKSIQRQTWKHINLSGTYYGAMDALAQSTCPLSATATQPFFTTQNITATVSASQLTGNITMTAFDGTTTMSFSGNYTQYGALFEVSGTLNLGGALYSASIRDFTADDDGIRGNLIAQGTSGCFINIRFAALRPG